jgi:uncharacterized membrane protein
MLDLKSLFTSIFMLILCDSFWLFSGGQYAVRMHERIQGSPVVFRYGAAGVVYLALAYLLSLAKSATQAFAMGLSTYAVYDFTNYALLKDYDIRFGIADTIWGGILFSAVFLALKGLHLS